MRRREVVTHGIPFALAACTGAIAGANRDKLLEGPIEEQPYPLGHPRFIAQYPIAIQRGVNIRNYPAIQRAPFFHIPYRWTGNTIPWESIESVNRTPLHDAGIFVVENAPFISGEDTSKSSPYFRNKGPWLRLELKLKGRHGTIPSFINYSWQTREYVHTLDYQSGQSDYIISPDGRYYLANGQTLRPEELGQVTVFSGINTFQDLWEKHMGAKLDGEKPLLRTDKKYDEVKVVPTGISCLDYLQSIRRGNLIQVLDSSATPVGLVKLSTIIQDVILTDETSTVGIFRRRNLQGELYDARENLVLIHPDRILIMNPLNLLSVQSSTNPCPE